MAEGIRYVCGSCNKTIEAWSDGTPYYFDDKGKKQYAYHPDPQAYLCVGNDSPHLCLSCGKEFPVDSEATRTTCPKCGSEKIVHTCELEGCRCPFCKKGSFAQDPNWGAIS